MIKLYTDPALLEGAVPHVPMLVPFLGPIDDPASTDAHRFDRYARMAPDLFRSTTLADCDVAVLPFDLGLACEDDGWLRHAARFHERVHAAGKRMLAFTELDSARRMLPLDGAIVFRCSLYASERGANEHAIPAFVSDFTERYLDGVPRPRRKGPVARVGFRGCSHQQAPLSLALRLAWARLRRRADGEPRSWRRAHTFASMRFEALTLLRETPGLATDFTTFEHYFAGTQWPPHDPFDWPRARHEREAYVRTLLDADYSLCVRGGGNFAIRLYETMSIGRIPVSVDTDCVLPLAHRIDWGGQLLSVDWRERARLGALVRDFHAGVSDAEFADRQRAVRDSWRQHLTPEAFFAHLPEYL